MQVVLLLLASHNIFQKQNYVRYRAFYNKEEDGCDMTKENEYVSIGTLLRIKSYIRKLDILRYLQNNDVSQVEKINYIEQQEDLFHKPSISPNISAGGLFNDWDWGF